MVWFERAGKMELGGAEGSRRDETEESKFLVVGIFNGGEMMEIGEISGDDSGDENPVSEKCIDGVYRKRLRGGWLETAGEICVDGLLTLSRGKDGC